MSTISEFKEIRSPARIKLSILLFLTGFIGVFTTSTWYTLPFGREFFFFSSFLLGAALLVFLFTDIKKNSKEEYVFITLLFLVSIVKVLGIHLKYGFYMGADAVLEHSIVNRILSQGYLDLEFSPQAEFPLSYIYTAVVSLFTGVELLRGSFNTVHLVTNALIVLAVYVLVRNSFSTKVAVISSFIVAYHPANTVLGLSMTRENFGLLFFMLVTILIIKQLKEFNIPYLTITLVFVSSLILSHYTVAYYSVLVYTLIFTLAALYSIKEKERKKIGYYLVPFTVFVGGLLYWISTTKYHLGDIGTARTLVNSLLSFLMLKGSLSGYHYESIALLKGTSPVEISYKIQGLFVILGCLFLIKKIKNKLPKDQVILGITSVFLTILVILWVITPELSRALPPDRPARYTILINALAAGFLVNLILQKLKGDVTLPLSRYWGKYPKNPKLYLGALLFLLMFAFVYPVTSYISDNVAFSKDKYPSELNDNMYNIRSMNEMMTLGLISEIIKEGPVYVEFPMLNVSGKQLMSKSFMHKDSYVFLRKSLYSYGQFLQYPEDFTRQQPYVVRLNEAELKKLREDIEKNDVLYVQDNYKLLHVE